MNTTLTLVNIFAAIVLGELIASPAAAVPLAAERAHCVDAGFSKPAAVAARDAFIDIFTGDTIREQLVAHEAGADHLITRVSALLLAGPTSSAAVIQVWVLLFLLHLSDLICFLEAPDIQVSGLLALDTARPEDLSTLVADHEVVLTALALGLGRPPQQTAMAAPLHKRGLQASVVTTGRGTVVLLVGQADARGTVQLLQLAVAALLLHHPAFFGFRGIWQRAVLLISGHSVSICTAGLQEDIRIHSGRQQREAAEQQQRKRDPARRRGALHGRRVAGGGGQRRGRGPGAAARAPRSGRASAANAGPGPRRPG